MTKIKQKTGTDLLISFFLLNQKCFFFFGDIHLFFFFLGPSRFLKNDSKKSGYGFKKKRQG